MSPRLFFKTTLTRVGWLRVLRLLIQFILLVTFVGFFITYAAWTLISSMDNADLIIDWFIRGYLDPALNIEIWGIWRDSVFWLRWYEIWSVSSDGPYPTEMNQAI